MLWILGHMVSHAHQMPEDVRRRVDTGWAIFFAGASLGSAAGYPTQQAMQAVSHDVNRRLYAKLGASHGRRLARPALDADAGNQTSADQIAFFMHDTYHVGQLAYARKALEHKGVAG